MMVNLIMMMVVKKSYKYGQPALQIDHRLCFLCDCFAPEDFCTRITIISRVCQSTIIGIVEYTSDLFIFQVYLPVCFLSSVVIHCTDLGDDCDNLDNEDNHGGDGDGCVGGGDIYIMMKCLCVCNERSSLPPGSLLYCNCNHP